LASGLGRIVLAVTERSWVRRLFTSTRPGRAVSTRFVAGESLDEAIAAARALNRRGATVSLDHLGEHVTDRSQAVAARDDYLAILDRLGAEQIDGNISVKLTQLGLGTDDELAAVSLAALAARARDVGTSVTVDMEESAHTEATITIFEKVQAEHGNLGVALQSYLKRTPDDLQRVMTAGGHVRLCKGAYAEPPEIAHQAKAQVDAALDDMIEVVMPADSIIPAVATHDDARISLTKQLAAARAGAWEFQMLYGVRPRLQERLLAEGHPLRIYVPYGVAWYPYLTRRLAERPANLWFFLRALFSRR
jgi:proline dehydrogenase